MTVSIRRFFRDQALWQGLKKRILPEFIIDGRSKVRFWSAGCACGEEVYSFKITWDGMSSKYSSAPDLEVLATGINFVYHYLNKKNRAKYVKPSVF
jgi:chemotaxis protein methyltransferase CheR